MRFAEHPDASHDLQEYIDKHQLQVRAAGGLLVGWVGGMCARCLRNSNPLPPPALSTAEEG